MKKLQITVIVLGFVFLGFQAFVKPVPSSPFQSMPVFQPEAQMLTQAINNSTTVISASDVVAANQEPFTVSSSLPKYSFDPSVCQGNIYPNTCFAKFYTALTSGYGVNVAIADIKERYSENGFIVSDCHPLMHIIGRTAASTYATVSDAYLHGDSFCWSGYYHGIMEAFVARIGADNLPKEINTICADIPGKATYDFNYYNCVHGIGHGIMELHEDDVPASLAICDNLTGEWERQSCYSGVFMENVIASTNTTDPGHVSAWLKSDDLLYPCDAVASKYQYECYLGQTSHALEVNGYDFAATAKLCAGVAEPMRDVCFQSYGRDAANQASHGNDGTIQRCWLPTDRNDKWNCIIGAAREYISYYHAETQATALCSALPDSSMQSQCQSISDSYYKGF